MLPEPSPEVSSALQLIRLGRFSDAVAVLQQRTQPNGHTYRRTDPLALSVLADALQRVGQNDRAEVIATRTLQSPNYPPQVGARCHFVLGNVYRDRGSTQKAIEHLQIATTSTGSDLELSCWSHLRLMIVLAELSGTQTAMARIDEVKRALTRFGDARPFAALHLWLVEIESIRGNLENARQHLKTADSLLSSVEDVWLRGYLAINSSAVHYYSAEMPEARRWAEIATECAEKSGHRPTLRAAHANLGSIEWLLGEHSRAQQSFQIALNCCESGSVHQIAILDNIAQIHLHRGDIDSCRSLISTLEALIDEDNHSKRCHYNAYALQTKIRLLLRDGKSAEALKMSQGITRALKGLPKARITAEAELLNVETLLANQQPIAAADALSVVLSPTRTLSPDLFAKFEQVSGRTLASSGAFDLARMHLERAAHTFDIIGHSLGKSCSNGELASLPETPTNTIHAGSQRTLDRIRALLDFRTRPELFGYEAASLLKELKCTATIDLVVDDGTQPRLIQRHASSTAQSYVTSPTSIAFDASSHRTVTLSFVPLDEPRAKLTALSFHRILKQILAIGSSNPAFSDQEIIWTRSERASAREGVVFDCDSMLAILRTIKQVAPTDVSVLITGETGTGKEVIARAIYEHSHRAAMPFLALNCAAVPKDLLESQLFGHRKGAFSGAAEAHPGIVRAANGGTLFLDEIGEIPIDVQAKLLRFLEMSEVHPVGETHPIKVNVRLIFATNGDLEEAVTQGRFRQDLFYRLNVIPIKVPPLRERREEIPVLTNLFAQRFGAEFSKDPVRFSSEAMELLILYAWPGNIRQLANEVRRVTALTESGALITPDHLSPHLHAQRADSSIDAAQTVPQMHVRIDQPLEKATAHLESEMIKHALRQAGGRVSAAASTLGISRKGLYLKRLRLGLVDFNDRAS